MKEFELGKLVMKDDIEQSEHAGVQAAVSPVFETLVTSLIGPKNCEIADPSLAGPLSLSFLNGSLVVSSDCNCCDEIDSCVETDIHESQRDAFAHLSRNMIIAFLRAWWSKYISRQVGMMNSRFHDTSIWSSSSNNIVEYPRDVNDINIQVNSFKTPKPCNACIDKVKILIDLKTSQEIDIEKAVFKKYIELSCQSIWFATSKSLLAIHWTTVLDYLLKRFELTKCDWRMDLVNRKLVDSTESRFFNSKARNQKESIRRKKATEERERDSERTIGLNHARSKKQTKRRRRKDRRRET